MYLQSLNVGSFCKHILLRDFNVNFCNQTHPFHSKLYNTFESFCLSQIVSDHTHLGPNGTTSMIDLIATSSSSLLQSCETIPPLANSDHMGLYYNHTGGKLDSLEVVLLDRSGYTNMQTGTKLVNLLRTQTGIPFLLMMSTLHGKIG